jgi:hypothetical protein
MVSHTEQSQNSQQSSAGQQTLQAPSNTGTQQSAISRSVLPPIGVFRARTGDNTGLVSFQTTVHDDLDMVVTRVDPADRSKGFYIWSVLDNPPADLHFALVGRVGANTWFECAAYNGSEAYARRNLIQRTDTTYGATPAPQQSTQDQLLTPEQSRPPTTNGG